MPEKLYRCSILVVQDIFLTRPLRLAHVVLPESACRKDGTLPIREKSSTHQARHSPVGSSLPDWQITCRIAKMMERRIRLASFPAEITDEIARLTPSTAEYHTTGSKKVRLQWRVHERPSGNADTATASFRGVKAGLCRCHIGCRARFTRRNISPHSDNWASS